MAKINTKIIYEKEEDILYLSKERTARASIEVGDFIVDIDMQGYVSAIEIINASENLGISPNTLEKMDKTSMSIVYKPGYIYIMLVLYSQDKQKDVAIPLTIDLGHKQIKREEIVFAK